MSNDDRWRRSPRVGPANPEAELDAEITFHLEELVKQLRAEGLSPEAARAEALKRFGELGAVRARTGSVDRVEGRRLGRLEAVRDALADFRFAGRLLRRSPGFTALAAICIGLGVGVTGAILSATHSILLRPLPYPRADELIAVYAGAEKRQLRGINISYPDYVRWRDDNHTLASLGIWTWTSLAFTDGEGDAERVGGASISPEIFASVGIRPLLGRLIAADDCVAGAQKVVLLGHSLWARRFASDSGIVGKSLLINGNPTVVIGVMPPKFTFPDGESAWVPFVPDADERHGNRGYAGAIGRLKPGVTVAAAAADLDQISIAMERELPNENLDWRADVKSLRDDLVGTLRRPLQVFLAAVGCLLLIVSANVANLLLARGFGRRREMAVRAAIGAGRQRLLRQLLVESLTLSALGGVVGVGVAALGIRLLAMTFPDGVPSYLTLRLDPLAVGFVFGVTVLTGLLAGLWPAFRTSAGDLSGAFRDGGLGGSGSAQSGRMRAGLVVAEIALSVVLLVSGGLLVRSFAALASTDLGFDRRGMVTARLSLPAARYPERHQRIAFYESLLDKLGRIPGVVSAGSAQGTPMSGWNVQGEMVIEGMPARSPDNELDVHYQSVSPRFFETLGVPILAGRGLTAADRDTANLVAVINDIFAKREFGDQSPIGRRVRFGQSQVPDSNPRWITIVGVVKSYRHYRLPERMGPAIYLVYHADPAYQQDVILRVERGSGSAVVPAIRAAVRELDPAIPVYRAGPFDDTLARVLWQQRLQGEVTAVFAALALVLATIGIYGVISYNVSQRTRELGIRAAIGASKEELTRMVVWEGGRLALFGIAIGLAAAFAFTRLLTTLLYGVAPTDPVVFLGAPLVLALVATLASWLPGRRAAKASPLVAIRSD